MRQFVKMTIGAAFIALMTIIPVTVAAVLESQLQTAKPGDVISFSGITLPTVPLNRSPNQLQTVGGYLLYSDDPESATETGILYRDSFPAGIHRIYLYHVNDTNTLSKFSIVLENKTQQDAAITFRRKALPAASGNYIQVGRLGVERFYNNTALPADFTLAAGSTAILDPALEAVTASRNQLVGAIYEYETSQPLTVSTVMLAAGTNTLAVYPTLEFAENDGSNRQGSFHGFTRTRDTPYSYNTTNGIRYFRVAGNEILDDPHITGIDAETSAPVKLLGNYGVNYEIKVNVQSTDNKVIAVVVNPRGGGYGGYFRTTFAGGPTQGTFVPLANSSHVAAGAGGVIAIVRPTAVPQPLIIEFIPAGASSLPINIMLVPFQTVHQWSIR